MEEKDIQSLIEKYGEYDVSAYGYEKMKRIQETELTQGAEVQKIQTALDLARRHFETTLLINVTKNKSFNKDNFLELLRWEELPVNNMITLSENEKELVMLMTNLY